MGWQSYVLPYRDEEHKKLILKIIKEHNEADWDEVERGEELYSIVDAAMTNTNTKWVGCILCGHGGGRSYTFQWFEDHKVEAYGYGREPFELVPEEAWVEITPDYMEALEN